MSDDENENNIDDNILNEEEEEGENAEDDFLVKEIKNQILENNQVLLENGNEEIMNKIIKLHENLGIKDDELIEEIEICVKNQIVDFSLIEIISLFADKTRSSEKVTILKDFYKFILDPEFDEKQLDTIRKLIPKILEKIDAKNISFRDILLQIKIEIILTIFGIQDKYIKKVIIKCIEKNWNISSIKTFYVKLQLLIPEDESKIKNKREVLKIKIKNEEKKHIMESLLETITAFPMNNLILNLSEINFKELDTIARDFYLKCSTTSDCPKKALDTNDLLIALENKNLNYFSKEKIELFRYQIKKAKRIRKPGDFKQWVDDFKRYDFKSNEKNEYIAEALGVISCALEETKKFPLREAQILAILIFIDNNESQEDDDIKEEELKNEIIIDNKNSYKKKLRKIDNTKGIIEQISTGEGKSAIISCLSAYYGLRNHKVDIITSSRTLAVRDSIEFKEFYQLFGLVVDYVKDYQPAPYKADITYGTFLDFEGDLLNEISYNKPIRGDRPYDIIIIDEVDNAFIDCIQGSTQLTHSSKGYQFLIPLYVSIYLFVDLLDHMYLEESLKNFNEFMSKEEYKDLDENSKKRIFEQISDNYERKDVFLKYIKKVFEELKGELVEKDPNLIGEFEGDKGNFEKIVDATKEAKNSYDLKKDLVFPVFLKDFVDVQINNWTNSAFCAKNLYKKETDYTISCKSHDGYESITPIDRKNTGELEFNTVYRNGLHQMLQIKENLRVKSETLTHTFLSHITYFIKFKKKNFFGLTGTIGGEETHSIYKRDSFNSNLVFIPSYMAKRFIELPAIICEEDFEEHIKKICEEIFYHFSKGRKILVICKDINEGINIDNNLHKDTFVAKDPLIQNNIFLYVRNDIDDLEEDLKRTDKRIIISTNLGGRGTDIKTTPEQEKNGGLHVIITKLSSNSRTQMQAFGRTSRQGNKGSGQFIITKKKNLVTYDQLINERNKKEKEMIDKINLDDLLLKDELFQEYVECLRKYPELNEKKGNNTKDEIDERWSFFLKKNFKDDIEEEEMRKNFGIFKSEIDKIMSLPRYLRFNNDFLRITDAFNFDDDEELSFNELYKYLNFKDCDKCFYFAASYLKGLVEWSRYNTLFHENGLIPDKQKESIHCKKIIEHLKMAKAQLKRLIEINIEPTLKSVIIYQKFSGTKYFKEIEGFQKTAFYKQFETRKKILMNLIEHIDKNIRTTEEYIRDYLPKMELLSRVELCQENVKMKKCLNLRDDETKELEYLFDAGLDFTYELTIRRPVLKKNKKYYFISLGFFVSFFISLFSISEGLKFSAYLTEKLKENSHVEMVDVHEERSLFTIIKNMVTSIFQARNNENQNENNGPENQNEIHNENIDEDDNNENGDKNDKKKSPENISKDRFIELKEKTLKMMKTKIKDIFNKKIKEIYEEIKFLVFVDYFFKEKKWYDIIINIILNSFDTHEMLLKKGEIIRSFNKESEYDKAIAMLTEETEKAIENIKKGIKSEFDKKGYEINKVKRLEHIIIRKRLEDIDYETSVEIVNQILSQDILNAQGKFKKSLFINKEDKKNKTKEKNKEDKKVKIQYVNIFYDAIYPKEVKDIKPIKNIDDFTLKETFKIKFEHDLLLQDVQMLYLLRNYPEPDNKLFKDFSTGIKDIIKEVYEACTDDITDKFNSFILAICQKIYEKIKTYLEMEIFPNILINKRKTKKKKLNEEEQKVVDLINENSGQKTFDIMKLNNFKEFFNQLK